MPALLPTISELVLVGVADRGVPNKERVVLRPTENIDLSEFALIAVAISPDRRAVPLRDTFFWLGDLVIAPPSWLYVYTGPGAYQISRISTTKHPVHVYHWGRQHVLFHDGTIEPALVRFGGIAFGGTGQTNAPMTEAEWSEIFNAIQAPPPLPGPPRRKLPPPAGPPSGPSPKK